MFDNLPRIIRGDASPATLRLWMRDNLHLDKHFGWASDNLALCAWFTELRASMKEHNAVNVNRLRDLIYDRFKWEQNGHYGGIECFGRVYALWNYEVRLCLYRFAKQLGWDEERELLRGWLRSHAVAMALGSGDAPGRAVVDHQIPAGDAGVPVPILGVGELFNWWTPFVAWSGDRGCQRTRDGNEWGRWQYLQESPMSGPLTELLGLQNVTRRQEWMEWWAVLLALDEAAPDTEAPLGCTAAEVELLKQARANDTDALREVVTWLWRPPVPFRIVRTTQGVWTMAEEARGSSTAHLDACAWWMDGRTGFLCGDPGWREPGGQGHVRTGRARVEVEGDRRYAVAEREGRAEKPRLELPGGMVLLDVLIDEDGVSLSVPAPVGQPVKPGQIVPPVASQRPRRGSKTDERLMVGAAVLGGLLAWWQAWRSKPK